jgi:hypothetical protein
MGPPAVGAIMDGPCRKGADTVFRRRSKAEDVDADGIDEDSLDSDELDDADLDDDDLVDDAPGGSAYVESDPVVKPAPPSRPTGPVDIADLPAGDEIQRIDLGSLHVPVPDGLEVRVDVQDDVIVAATMVDGSNELTIHAFAAPRSSGLWSEVRDEIAESLRESGGAAETAEGPFGAELRARVPVEGGGNQPARFVGVDGPRWFLRGLVTGPASTDPVRAKKLEAAFRGVVVNRGGEAMAPRDMLPLRLPVDVVGEPPPAEPPNHSLELPERGPEITEIQ